MAVVWYPFTRFTDVHGHLSWVLLGCPCLEHRDYGKWNKGQLLAPETGTEAAPVELFGFHKAKQIIQTVHDQEANFYIRRDDCAMRLIITIADNTIQG